MSHLFGWTESPPWLCRQDLASRPSPTITVSGGRHLQRRIQGWGVAGNSFHADRNLGSQLARRSLVTWHHRMSS